MALVTRVTDLIGNTPLFELATTDTGTRLLLKLEQLNPTGAAKIRMAREMVLDAERRDLLRDGGHIIESTSGNTGLGLAVVAAERGYRFTAVVDHHACRDKLRAMQAMGAELVYVADDGDARPNGQGPEEAACVTTEGPRSGGSKHSLATSAREDLAEAMAAARDDAYFTEQHNNDANALGYYAVAEELLEDLGQVDILLSAVGTGGSLFGTARRLRELGCRPRVIGVEPVGSIAFGGEGGPYWQSGTGTPPGATVGTAVDYSLLDEGLKVTDVAAFATTRAVARKAGLLIGGSAGGSVHAALTRLEEFPPGSTIVTIVCDGGEKYLDTVFDDDWMAERDLLDETAERDVLELLDRYSPARRDLVGVR
ncbi:cystathionine beta-synthase [Nocardia transvalensis]|uniref:Cystathionine beta-synthase n=1 Tax=Nocardia transvalensis TaxID=37333 RepID=A0A7W9PB07_9NOCA|nr:cysteine synthase family protein [Nocardia transvalensis]MBB5912695.1 cystathionine beta-synthase [Nocardia transvalensis]